MLIYFCNFDSRCRISTLFYLFSFLDEFAFVRCSDDGQAGTLVAIDLIKGLSPNHTILIKGFLNCHMF